MPARRTTTLLATGLLALTVSACGSGLDPQTYKERSTQDAVNANAGALALRDVSIQPPANGQSELAAGSDAQVTLAIVNPSTEADTLSSVTVPSSVAATAQLVDRSGHATPAVPVPAGASLAFRDFGIVLHGLTQPLRPGMYIELTLMFERNGQVTVQVPVKVFDTPVPRDSFSPPPAEKA